MNKKVEHVGTYIILVVTAGSLITTNVIDIRDQWTAFIVVAAFPLSILRIRWRTRFNFFDKIGWLAAAVIGALMLVNLFKGSASVTPGEFVERMLFVGLYGGTAWGVLCVPAFLWDWLPERKRRPRPPRRKMPYSAPGGGGDLGFDPAAFGVEGPEPQAPGRGGRGFFGRVAGGSKRTPPEPQTDWQEETRRLSLLAYERELAEGEERARQQARELAARESGERSRQQQTEEEKFREALRLFGLKEGYTLAELRARYRELSKKLHPDAGGTEGLFQQIETAFRILSRRAGQ